MERLSKSQINKLGERLRKGPPTEADLRTLEEFRQSYALPYTEVAARIRERLGVEPTGRPAKSTNSIVDKLKRQKIRLAQIQDIAGGRIVVEDIVTQDHIVQELVKVNSEADIIDRRQKSSNGYRAVHVVIKHQERLIEIQVRTNLQHVWACYSELTADLSDPRIKYGIGPEDVIRQLNDLSRFIEHFENTEKVSLENPSSVTPETLVDLTSGQTFPEAKANIILMFTDVISSMESLIATKENLKVAQVENEKLEREIERLKSIKNDFPD